MSLLAGIVDGSDDAIVAKDMQGHIIAWNPAAQRLFGYTEEEAIGAHIGMLIPEALKGEDQRVLDRVLEGNQMEHYETQRLTKDGNAVEVSVRVSPLKDADGVIIGASKIIRDIGQHREARRREAQLAAIIASSDDAILSKDTSGTITSWNPAAQRMFGYEPDEVIGQHISILFPPDLLGTERDVLGEILQGKRVDHYETRRLTRDGRIIDVSLTVSPLRDPDGTIVGASKIVRDISEAKRTAARDEQARELARANLELAAADRAKDEFLAMANHELRTPLTSIAGFTSTMLQLDEALSADQRREFLQIIERQTERLSRLIDDLMTLSRVRVDRAHINAEPTHVTQAIREILREQDRTDVEVVGDDEACACVDPQHLSQMVLNYVDNAAKYGAGTIRVDVSPTLGDTVEVVVADEGAGVPAELVPHLFERFTRGDREREAGVPGTGLGLSIVRNLARAQGGDAWYEPNEPVGSRFCLRLPRPSGD
ncbi:MAG: hypothetical protein JWM86_611 [Thermoleophilia bacterium]|nr:hypothetical protein [Thermoleophilia bacterium]